MLSAVSGCAFLSRRTLLLTQQRSAGVRRILFRPGQGINAPQAQFARKLVRVVDRLMFESTCMRCGMASLVSGHDGTLEKGKKDTPAMKVRSSREKRLIGSGIRRPEIRKSPAHRMPPLPPAGLLRGFAT